MKRLLIFLMTWAISVSLLADTKEHIVERGETIESIAKLYNITTEELITANPSAKDMFYAGMILTIPESSNSSSQSNTTSPMTTEVVVEAPQGGQSMTISPINENGIEQFDNWFIIYNARFDYFEHGYFLNTGIMGLDGSHLIPVA